MCTEKLLLKIKQVPQALNTITLDGPVAECHVFAFLASFLCLNRSQRLL